MEKKRKLMMKEGIYQILAACIAHSITIQAGINMAFSTILLPDIMNIPPDDNTTLTNTSISDTGQLNVSMDEASWIASLVTITTPVGSLMTGKLMDRFGRKTICAATSLPFVVSWTMVALTRSDVRLIYAARILAGVGGGLSTAAMVYVSEISHPSLRPMLLSLTSVVVSLGILVTSILGYFFHWKTVAVCSGLIAAVSFVAILFIPESPSWYVGLRKKRMSEDPNVDIKLAEKSLKWLNRNPEDYGSEFENLLKIKEKRANQKKEQLVKSRSGQEDDEVVLTDRNPERSTPSISTLWKPIGLMSILFFLQQFSGCYVVIFYAVQIFGGIGSVELDQFTCLVILGFVRFFMAILTVFLSKTFGRKPLLISSALGTMVSMFSAAFCLHFWGPGVVPSVLVLIFVFFSSYGIMVIPWTLIGEILPLKFRAMGSGALIAAAYVLMFITVKLFVHVLHVIGMINVFSIFGSFSLLLAMFVYFFVPETLGKTLNEIEAYFTTNSYLDRFKRVERSSDDAGTSPS